LIFATCVLVTSPCFAQPAKLDRAAVLESTLHPYTGQSVPGIDTKTLHEKVVCGYQGWFNCEGDGADRGWVHWSKDRKHLDAETVRVDLWPDVSELGADERFATGLNVNGRPAEVFSSYRSATVLRHFEWMRQYGIDGAMVQRFAADLGNPLVLRHANTVLSHCREGANRNGRCYAVMYDLSGLRAGGIDGVIDDWRELQTRMQVTRDPAYLRHRGRPLVAVWGVGFNDGRAYTLDDCRKLVEFLKHDPEVGGCTVMLGVPTHWLALKGDAANDPALHGLLKVADVISPWTVGRYRTPAEAARYAERHVKPELAWCEERGLDYLPVAYPGFSWHNMRGDPLDAIPRLKGDFLWSQFTGFKQAGARMIYVAMFDEVDEGTAIFKCTNDVPDPKRFVTYEGLPSDHYLGLTGAAGKLLRGEMKADAPRPVTADP
jgi:hypothetical protein